MRAKIRRVKAARVRAGLRPVIPVSSRRRAAVARGRRARAGRPLGPAPDRPVRRRARGPSAHGEPALRQSNSNAYVYDPVTGDGHRVDPPSNLFCAGQVPLADGRILFVGGQLDWTGGDNFFGLNQIWIFDPVAETWTRQVDMRHGRWYPTATRLPDGRVLITSGWDETGTQTMNRDVEIFTPAARPAASSSSTPGGTWSSTPTGTSCRTAAP